jgi:predicted kinase
MLIAFAGLPGTGKTTLATQLTAHLGAVLLNKDHLRAGLFAPDEIEYSREQDDFCVAILYQLAEYHLRRRPSRPVILDGRTYSQRYQIDALKAAAARCLTPLKIIECTCSDATALIRLAADTTHPAIDRTPALYHRVKTSWQPIDDPKLVITTECTDTPTALDQVLTYLHAK